MMVRARILLILGLLPVMTVMADEALDDSYAFQAAKVHNTADSYRSYLKHCQVCLHREAAAKQLDASSGIVMSVPFAPELAVTEVVRSETEVVRSETIYPASSDNRGVVSTDWAAAGSPLKLIAPGQFRTLVNVSSKPVSRPVVAVSVSKPVGQQYFSTADAALQPQRKNTAQLLKGHSRTVWSVAYDPKGAVLASGSADRKIRLWPLAEGGVSKQLSGHKSYISALDFSADGKFLASVSGDRSVRLWQNGKTARVLNHQGGEVSAVSFTTDSRRLISGSEDSMLHLWDVGSGRLQQSLNGHKSGVLAIDISPFGDEFASSDASGNVLLWKLGEPKEKPRRKLRIAAHNGMAYDVKYARDGQQLFTAGADGLINRWHRSGAQAGVLIGHRAGVTSLAVHRGGGWLLSGGRDQAVRVWNLKTGEQTAFYNTKVGEIYSLALSPSGRRLAVSGSGDAVQLIELNLAANNRG